MNISMKHVVIGMALMCATVSYGQQPASTERAEPSFKAHVLTRSEFDVLLQHPEKLLVIDVRRPDELTSVGGFPVYLSIQASELEKSLAWIPRDRTIVTVSNHAARAGKSADLLASRGFIVAGAVGAQLYEKDGGSLVHLAPPPPSSAAQPANKRTN